MLVEFPSSVEAVRMAMAVQLGMAERNADVPSDRRIEYRIGVNVGDVVADGEDLLGDGVNIAARLETLAPPGGIVLSHTVHDQIGNKLELNLADLGKVEVKNIDQQIRAFQVLREGEAPIAPARTSPQRRTIFVAAFGLAAVLASVFWFGVMPGQDGEIARQAEPEVASVAILPLEPLATDPEQELFAKGLTEDLNTALSRVPGLLVISQNSMASYRGKEVDLRDVAHEVGVDHVLTGSVQRSGEQLRISIQLILGEDGTSLWSRRYDRRLEDIFALQDEV
ncbi:MAG: adenylate/guanylate cyclase domain-containing protein, partial [Gammaproteobacteria bacterium]|nr:adenylate/guanylate cyclase domain-containing protein [Gammaproteobacteria bacterium]